MGFRETHRIMWRLLVGVGISSSAPTAITFTDLQGHQASVEVVEASNADVTFIAQGRRGTIALDQLAEASRDSVVAYAKEKGVFRVFPACTIQVKIAYQHRNDNAWYRKDVRINPSVVIEGAKKMRGLPAAEASLVLITHDTRQKYVFHEEKMEICSTETISIPAVESGERREFTFQSVAVSFDTARDTTNVGGDEYKYYIFGLRDAGTKQLVDFESNSPKVMAYVERHPEARETFLSARRGAPFADDFSSQ